MNKIHLKIIIFLCLTSIFLFSCNQKTKKIETNELHDSTTNSLKNSITHDVKLQNYDTTVILSKLKKSNCYVKKLTNNLAKFTLYEHFKKKGCYNSDNLPELWKISDSDSNMLSVDFDTIYQVDLNNNKCKDAIITYWLTPPYANGNCWQPHKATIIDTEKGFRIINEEFIPDNYAIDSVVNIDGEIIIYCYDYDCGNRKVLKNIRMRLK